MTQSLVVLTNAEKRLAMIATIQEAKVTDADLSTLEAFARAHNLDVPTQNRIVQARALVQRKGGELIRAIPRAEGKRIKGDGVRPKLGLSGIALSVAQRWQALTTLEEATIRAVVAARTEAKQSVHLGYFYKLALPPKAVHETPGWATGPFRAIVIDPPWPIGKISLERRPMEREAMDYETWDLDRIKHEIPVARLADASGCHIYLWVTHKHLPFGLECFGTWGVRYECLLTWIKPTALPLWWAYTTEHCLFGKIGTLAPIVKGTPTGFTAPQQRHSHKPSAFFDLVRKVSPEPRYTIFDDARSGFEHWGVSHVL